MSYDLFLFEQRPGEGPAEAIERLFYDESEEMPVTAPDEIKSARRQKLASVLVSLNPAFEVFKFPSTQDEAEQSFSTGHIELSSPAGGNGIQITLYDDSANLTIPYWYQRDKAPAVFADVWKYLQVIQAEAGYKVFDPQMEAVLELSDGYTQVVDVYLASVAVTQDAIDSHLTPGKKPWWKFW